jgi:hypothetical protein
MRTIESGRLCSQNDQDIVVFLIGAKINKWWLLPFALPVLIRMRSMQKELLDDPDSGLLGLQSFGGMDVQYWRSVEDLHRYAEAGDKHHKPTWKKFYQKLFRNASVGVWHETFIVPAGHYESVYVNMPRLGLGKCTPLQEAIGSLSSSRGRLATYYASTSTKSLSAA